MATFDQLHLIQGSNNSLRYLAICREGGSDAAPSSVLPSSAQGARPTSAGMPAPITTGYHGLGAEESDMVLTGGVTADTLTAELISAAGERPLLAVLSVPSVESAAPAASNSALPLHAFTFHSPSA